jgi:AcrR family transcriptional regulator
VRDVSRTPEEAEPGLRERKKRATRRTLQRAALELVAERGLANVTVEEIAAAADVSPRTFFNYFPGKDEALTGTDPADVDEICAAVATRPAEETPLAALREVFVARAERAAGDSGYWQLRMRVAQTYPELAARMIGASAALDARLTEVLAERTGADPDVDPRPALAAGIASAARRTSVRLWAASDFARPYPAVLAEAFDAVGDVVP